MLASSVGSNNPQEQMITMSTLSSLNKKNGQMFYVDATGLSLLWMIKVEMKLMFGKKIKIKTQKSVVMGG